jgi:hypothetical protein
LNIPTAIGERQMLAVQTNKTAGIIQAFLSPLWNNLQCTYTREIFTIHNCDILLEAAVELVYCTPVKRLEFLHDSIGDIYYSGLV